MEPMSEKKGQPNGSGVASGICAKGIDMSDNRPVEGVEFVPMAHDIPCQNSAGIGEGQGQAFPVADKEKYGAI